jgi:methionine synthase II (cobalamin-independent)
MVKAWRTTHDTEKGTQVMHVDRSEITKIEFFAGSLDIDVITAE